MNLASLLAVSATLLGAEPQVEQEELPYNRFAVKYAPGISAAISIADRAFGAASWMHAPGIEVRLSRYFTLRGDVEVRGNTAIWQIPGIKLTGMPSSRVRPFVSLSLQLRDEAGRVGVGLMKAAGLDVTLWKWFFLTGEVRVSAMLGDCCSLPRVGGALGVGAQFL